MTNEFDPMQSFEKTKWSVVERAQADDDSVRRKALGELFQIYAPALRAHLVHKKRMDVNEANDVIADFITDKMIEKDLVAEADKNKGKFRSLLVKSLEHYLIDRNRKLNAKKREGERRVKSLDDDSSGRSWSVPMTVDSDVFDVAWAKQVLEETVRRMREECDRRGQRHVWEVFRRRILLPNVENAPVPRYDELAKRCGLESPTQANSAMKIAKQRFRKVLRTVIAEYEGGGESVDEELDRLRQFLVTANVLGLDEPADEEAHLLSVADASGIDLSHEHAPQLGNILDDEKTLEQWNWGAEDYAGLWRHQASMPFFKALEELAGNATRSTDATGRCSETLPASMGAMLLDPNSPLAILKQVKRCAREQVRDAGAEVPPEIALVLYFGAIAAAFVHKGERITKLNDEGMRQGFRQMVSQTWLDDETRRLFIAARAKLDGEEKA